MFRYKKKYNDLLYKIIRLKDTKEIYNEHVKVIYKVSDDNDKTRLDAKIKANSDLIKTLNEILKHREEKIGIFGYKRKYKEFWQDIYFLKEGMRVQRDQYKWKIDFSGSPAYSTEEKSRLEGLYEYTTGLIIELNNTLGIEV